MADFPSEPAAKGGTVASAMAILRLLAAKEQPIGVNAIARELSLAPSSCFKILKSLLADDFVEIDPATKGYSLGNGAITVARRALDPSRAFSVTRVRLDELAQDYSIAIGLWRMMSKDRIVLIGFAEGANQMRIHMSLGQRLPSLVGAVGRAIAAQMDLPDAELRRRFSELRWQKSVDYETYAEQVRDAKRRGYGYDAGTFSAGVNTVAATIVDETGVVRYGLSGIMFSGQHSPVMVDRIGQALMQVRDWATLRLVNAPLR